MNTLFVIILFNLSFVFSRWNVAASEQEEADITAVQEQESTGILESYLDPFYLLAAGYYNDPLTAGVSGSGEASDLVRITFINGILNRHQDCMETAELISRTHGGTNVHYIYRPTEGW